MNSYIKYTGILLSALFFLSCATSGSSSEKTYRSNLGTATDRDIQRIVPNIISRYNFTMYREEITLDGIYYETEWKERDLFDDEVNLGITEARSRIIVSARPRTAQATSLHRVNFEVENHVKFEGEEGWNRETITEEAESYFSEIARTLNVEFASGIRSN
jgi:hypothetical protein